MFNRLTNWLQSWFYAVKEAPEVVNQPPKQDAKEWTFEEFVPNATPTNEPFAEKIFSHHELTVMMTKQLCEERNIFGQTIGIAKWYRNEEYIKLSLHRPENK